MRFVLVSPSGARAKTLKTLGFDVQHVTGGIEGLRKIITSMPDIALMDVDQADLSGIGLARTLELLRIPVPVIFTAKNEEKMKEARALKNCADFFVGENFDNMDEAYFKRVCKQGKEKQEQTDEDMAQLISPCEWAHLMAPSGRKRILVVEDDPISRKLLTLLLHDPAEMEIFTAENGLIGLFKAMLVKPDLILSDLAMPEVDGLTMAQIMYLLGKPFPIVFLTATSDGAMVKKTENLKSVIGYVVKGDMGNKVLLLRTIRQFITTAIKSADESAMEYQHASPETLLNSTTGAGGLDFLAPV